MLVHRKSRVRSIKYRICIDYRALNAVTKLDAYPIPNIIDTLDSFGQSKFFFCTRYGFRLSPDNDKT